MDPNLPAMDATGNDNGTWYVFADQSRGKAVQMDFLVGHESPEICMKASDKVGASSPFEGNFENDSVFYRVRHIFGGATLDPRFAYAQVHA